jgi:hypothetical protein
MLGSQRNSISRYEADRVQPSLSILWKLYHLAEKDEKDQFMNAIRSRIGVDLTGRDVMADIPLADVRQFVDFEERIAALNAWNPNHRHDFHDFLTVVLDLVTTARTIDASVSDILRIWHHSPQDRNAGLVFREAAAFLRVSLSSSGSTADRGGPKSKRAKADPKD